MCTMTLLNRSQDASQVCVAVFKRPITQAALGTIAWKVVSLMPNVPAVISTRRKHRLEVRSQCQAGMHRDAPIEQVEFDESGLDCIVEADPDLRIATRAVSADSVDYGDVRIENRAGIEVWASVFNGGFPVYPAFVIRPGQIRSENLRQPFYMAVISAGISPGDRLDNMDLLATQTRVVDGSLAVIRGDMNHRSIELFSGVDASLQ